MTLFKKYHRDSILNSMENDNSKPFEAGVSRAGDSLGSSVTRESDKFMLRLPDGMRQLIAEEAKKNGRSMNAEIVIRLQESINAKNYQEQFSNKSTSDKEHVINTLYENLTKAGTEAELKTFIRLFLALMNTNGLVIEPDTDSKNK